MLQLNYATFLTVFTEIRRKIVQMTRKTTRIADRVPDFEAPDP